MQQMKDREGLDTTMLGTQFDRQVRIDGWDQKAVRGQSVLVLGVGGLGSAVTLNLLRLGVGKIFLVDYDVVDIHNLNRQLLFTTEDVGKPKVEAALRNSAFHNVGKTQIQIFHGNALTHWQTIVGFAKRATFVYNCIDWGDKFDIAVGSLCFALKLPLVMGGTFATSLTVDYIPPTGSPCFLCTDDFATKDKFIERITPELILALEDISFLPKNNNPIGRSSVLVCTICGELMVSHQINWLFLSQQKPYKASRLIFYHNTFQIVKFDLEANPKCPFCGKPEEVAPILQQTKVETALQTEEKQSPQKNKQLDQQIIVLQAPQPSTEAKQTIAQVQASPKQATIPQVQKPV